MSSASGPQNLTRRDFTKVVAGFSAATALGVSSVRSSGKSNRPVRVGWIGTGRRGGHDMRQLLNKCDDVELVAMADVFPDHLDAARQMLKNKLDDSVYQSKVKVGDDDAYVGLDAYRKVLERDDVDLIVHSTPPGFRPKHFSEAIAAGKHVFMEKPAATDPTGIRTILDAAAEADRKGLSVVVGTQQRHMPNFHALMKRVEDGQMGELVSGQAFWHGGTFKWHWHPHKAEWSDTEYQIRSWPYFTWLGGDCVVEQHVHFLDVLNWFFGRPPSSVLGRGGRQQRTGEQFGNVYDHFSAELNYGQNLYASSFNSQMKGASGRTGVRLIGTKGVAWVDRSSAQIRGANDWKYDGPMHGGTATALQALLKAIHTDKPINEAPQLAEATLTGIMIRESAYTGRELKWQWALKGSKQDLFHENLSLDQDLAVRPVAVPGQTKLR